jgi:hypothetical protein
MQSSSPHACYKLCPYNHSETSLSHRNKYKIYNGTYEYCTKHCITLTFESEYITAQICHDFLNYKYREDKREREREISKTAIRP